MPKSKKVKPQEKTSRQESTAPTRIFLVDDHAFIRGGICSMIHDRTDMMICGEAASAPEALEGIS